jgi:NAD kinase
MGVIKPYEKIVLVTKKTALEELIERFNTEAQAEFYLEHMGASFDEYKSAHEAYQDSLIRLRQAIPGHRTQIIERSYLPNFLFGPRDVVVTLGPDGLVINTAKYLNHQPLVAFNPDPSRVDGVLIPFPISQANRILDDVLYGMYQSHLVTMAKATLNDGQCLYAVNDLFIGAKTHVSARYQLRFGDKEERQSSSGIIVSTGAGSTGWLRSILTGSVGIVEGFSEFLSIDEVRDGYRFDYQAEQLCFCVREPFISRVSSADLVFGRINRDECLEVVSQMPQNGVIFSDGIENDFLQFDSGAIAKIEIADKQVNLVIGVESKVPGTAFRPPREM